MKKIEDFNKPKNDFLQSLKNIENEENELLNLQKQYRSGKIKEKEMTKDQIKRLCNLYDKQILELKKSNGTRKQKLLEYRKKLKNNI